MNATNNCVAACPKGSGTATDNLNYSNCVQGCIAQNYYTAGGTLAGASPTGGSGGSGTAGGSNPTGTDGASGSATTDAQGHTQSGSATKSGSSASSTPNAANEVLRVGSSAVGLVGFLAAIMAL